MNFEDLMPHKIGDAVWVVEETRVWDKIPCNFCIDGNITGANGMLRICPECWGQKMVRKSVDHFVPKGPLSVLSARFTIYGEGEEGEWAYNLDEMSGDFDTYRVFDTIEEAQAYCDTKNN